MAQARTSALESEAKNREFLIEQLRFAIAELKHGRFGQSSERRELQL